MFIGFGNLCGLARNGLPKGTAALVMGFALFIVPQEHMTASLPTPLSSLVDWLDQGLVEGKTYKNASLGLEVTPAPQLTLGNPVMRGKPGTLPLMITVTALGQTTWSSAREAFLFYADTLAYYPPDQRSTDSYIRKVVRANQKDGFEVVRGSRESKLGGVLFARADFFKKGPAYEAVLVRSCDKQALVFVFTGSDKDIVDKLIAGTELKLDLSISGCDSKSVVTSPK